MKFCPKCETRIKPGANYCYSCGTRIATQGTIPHPRDGLGKLPTVSEQQSNITVRSSPTKIPPIQDNPSDNSVRRFSEILREVKANGLEFEELPESVRTLLANKGYYVVKYRVLKEQEGEYGEDVSSLKISEALINSLKDSGRSRLYKFQERAIDSILNGDNTVIVAPTGNGKTLAFALPIFHNILSSNTKNDHSSNPKALFIYPTKALARDQLKALNRIIASERDIRIQVFDGDTPEAEKQKIVRSPPDILITNFDTIEKHLRFHGRLAGLLTEIKYVVVDELHTYIGVFGSHAYFILRRLKRINQGNFIQLIGSSATIRNPSEFASVLFESRVTEIKCEVGRRGRIHILMLYPSKSSMTSLMANSTRFLLRTGMKSLIFANTHKNAEVLNLALRQEGVQSDLHRAGLLTSQRLQIEESFKNGELKCIVATPTLELGIDIGDLDAVVSMITGITTLTQRIGRAGRKGQESIAILALRAEDPISAFYKNHPNEYFQDIDRAYVEPKNPVVARLELIGASMDKPLEPGEFSEFKDILNGLVETGLLEQRSDRKLYPTIAARKEVENMNVRGIGETVFIIESVQNKDKIIGDRQMPMALRELFPGAAYLLGGKKYQSAGIAVELEIRSARVRRLEDSYRFKTDAIRHSDPEIIKTIDRQLVKNVEVLYSSLRMTEVVDGYQIRDIFSDEKIGPPIYLPRSLKYTYETKGLVFSAPRPQKGKISSTAGLPLTDEDFLMGSFHALEHTLIEGSDSITGSGSSEIGGVSMGSSGAIFVYDGCVGGSGLSRLLFGDLERAFQRTLSILKECKCKSVDGCPACTYSYQCGNNNEPLNKQGAIDSLEKLFSGMATSMKDLEFKGEKTYL